eukprot:CAMPEP_0202948246 /NCGR_PEP_ID=MMETSP1395-20130829/13179_1 /ASSEMBLY_ACC=CAM_ASM_000871 /TAXON_ID=5961 /ORGANISM="Blepharisma japonicum, Strain Stock R1072" /LENGTH=262 /DNA_ID=CAMNT_0049650149 /DNA_START=102 /DNA_END=886 /DNA_ORIENTATION=-
MEDAKLTNVQLDSNTSIFGVFDGHGGSEVAEFVSRHFSRQLLLTPAYREGRLEDALRETFLRMDELLNTIEAKRELVRISRNLPNNYPVEPDDSLMAGCTAVVSLVRGNQLIVAHAGDSRCVLCREERALEITRDHKPDLPEERTRIIRAGGNIVDGRIMGNLNLSRSIGDLEYKKNASLPPQDQIITAYPDVRRETITENDEFFILACDGVWEMLNSQQAIDFVHKKIKSKPITVIADEMLDRCLARDVSSSGGLGCDNMT